MKTFVYIGIIGASALLLASCKGKSKPMETPVPSISVSTPIVRDITLTKEYPGYLSSQLKVDLVARVNGYLRTSYLKAGSRVKKGDLIFVIEPDTYQDNVTQAEASVKTSKAQLEYARSNYERMKEAAKSGAVSQIQVIQAEATVSESEAAVKNAEAAAEGDAQHVAQLEQALKARLRQRLARIGGRGDGGVDLAHHLEDDGDRVGGVEVVVHDGVELLAVLVKSGDESGIGRSPSRPFAMKNSRLFFAVRRRSSAALACMRISPE